MSSPWAIENATLILPDGLRTECGLVIREGVIERLLEPGESAGCGTRTVDAAGGFLAPGFIDLHIHGTHRHLVDNGPADLTAMAALLPRYGVTGWLPTVCPSPPGEDAAFLRTLASAKPRGANVLGFHLEGPFLSITGALPKAALGSADPRRVQALMDAAGPYRAVFSISPEFKGILDLIPLMVRDGAPVFMTHTRAGVADTRAAIEAGARHATHFYDVFPVPEETDPGVRPCGAVEAILADPRVTVDFILDGVHVDPVALRMALQCKGPGGVCLVSDANVGAGLPPGRYAFGEAEVEFTEPGGPARGTRNSPYPGCLAGSGLTLDRAVRNAFRWLGQDLPLAVRMASVNPAAVLNLETSKGRLAPGWDADLVLLSPDLDVEQTWVGGHSVYCKGDPDEPV
jgi:N-acetylglucosamine-6-phosphate deacetylase